MTKAPHSSLGDASGGARQAMGGACFRPTWAAHHHLIQFKARSRRSAGVVPIEQSDCCVPPSSEIQTCMCACRLVGFVCVACRGQHRRALANAHLASRAMQRQHSPSFIPPKRGHPRPCPPHPFTNHGRANRAAHTAAGPRDFRAPSRSTLHKYTNRRATTNQQLLLTQAGPWPTP